MKNLGNMLKQAQEMQSKMAEMQARMQEAEVVGTAGGGMVEMTMNGAGALRRVKIDKSLATPDEIEVLEDLIIAAHADAKKRSEEMMQREMEKLTGGLQLPPGFKLPF